MTSEPAMPAAVYQRGLGYSDEHTIITVSTQLEELISRWRAGEKLDITGALAEHNRSDADPDRLLSVHQTMEEALVAVRAEHIRASSKLTLIDMGFHTFGCSVGHSPYTGNDDLVDYGSDLQRLRQWCGENDVPMPLSLNPSDPAVREACTQISKRSIDGALWLDFLDDEAEGAAPYAADLVADELRRTGRPDLAADLFSFLLCDLTYVGPASQERQASATKNESRGFLSRLFKR